MRDIIFRGMTKDRMWIEGCLTDWCGEHFISNSPTLAERRGNGVYVFGNFVEVLPDTIGQYTGLCDCNGTMIFEGDIVENDDERYIIEWSGHNARFVLSGETVEYDFDSFYGHDLEVIGNIYENKEMVEW